MNLKLFLVIYYIDYLRYAEAPLEGYVPLENERLCLLPRLLTTNFLGYSISGAKGATEID